MTYEVTLRSVREDEQRSELVEGADGYAEEGPLTTFFQGRDGRAVLDTWARRVASFRTADIVAVRLLAAQPAGLPDRPSPPALALAL